MPLCYSLCLACPFGYSLCLACPCATASAWRAPVLQPLPGVPLDYAHPKPGACSPHHQVHAAHHASHAATTSHYGHPRDPHWTLETLETLENQGEPGEPGDPPPPYSVDRCVGREPECIKERAEPCDGVGHRHHPPPGPHAHTPRSWATPCWLDPGPHPAGWCCPRSMPRASPGLLLPLLPLLLVLPQHGSQL